MSSGIFLIRAGDHTLVPLVERPYDLEEQLQVLLAEHPDLIPGDQIDSGAPRRWLLVKRELGIPDQDEGSSRWSLDHLFLDQDGVPTLVEVKRASDTRLRREVVGQMLDYAANTLAHWPAEGLRTQFEAGRGPEADIVLQQWLGDGSDVEAFWERVRTNLQAGRVRLIFVADEIPSELRRIVEFLNSQMSPAEVLALEIRQYVGEGIRTLIPRLVGQSARKLPPTRSASRQWDEASFFEALDQRSGPTEAATARQILQWVRDRGLRIWWGRGKLDGSFFPMFDWGGVGRHLISVWTYGRIEMQFERMQHQPPFDTETTRLELLRALNRIPGVTLPQDALTRRPTFPLSALQEPAALALFLQILDQALQQMQQPMQQEPLEQEPLEQEPLEQEPQQQQQSNFQKPQRGEGQ